MIWNSFQTDAYEGMTAETVLINGFNGDSIHAYYSHPLGLENNPGIVLIPHGPGWDEFTRETARRYTAHGFSVISPNIYERFGHGTPEEVIKIVRANGGAPDEGVVGDVKASMDYLRSKDGSNGKVGIIGMCSAGRHAFLAACLLDDVDCVADCWGGDVINVPEEKLTPQRPVQPSDYAEKLNCPVLGIFGADDFNPTLKDVMDLEEHLKKLGKNIDFNIYEGASHAFWCYDQFKMFRPEAAMKSWEKTVEFFRKHLYD